MRCLQALIGLDEVVPVKRLAAGEAGVMSGWPANAADTGRRKGPKIKRPGSGGGAAIRVSGECGWGDPHFSRFNGGQRMTVGPAAPVTAQAVTKVFAGVVKLVT